MSVIDISPTAAGERPRLLLISSEFPPGPGGIGTHAFHLARNLTQLGWGVRVLTPQAYASPSERDEFNRRQPFPITTLTEREGGRWWWVERMQAIAGAIRTDRPSLLMGTGQRALWTAAAAHSLYRIPWVAVGHGSEFLARSRAAGMLTRRAIASAAAVIAVSDYTAGLVHRMVRPRRIVVIPNAADGARFRAGLDTAALRRKWDVAGGRVLLTVGQVSERKAQDVVIRALPRILAQFPDIYYVIAGLPSRKAEFAALADELGVADRVRFTGLVDEADLPAAYNLSDLFVLVSRQSAGGDVEGYGIVVQEAALCGVPAVVSRECGLEEAIRDGETGLSVPPNDPASTAAAIMALLGDDGRRREMGRRAREMAQAATWSERVADYDRVLRDLLPPHPQLSR